MNTIHFTKAATVTVGGREIESMTLVFDTEQYPYPSLDEWETRADAEGKLLANHLLATLPQGVADRMIGHLMLLRSSLFVGPSLFALEEEQK